VEPKAGGRVSYHSQLRRALPQKKLTAGVRAKRWSEDSEGYASDAVDLGFSSGRGYCTSSDGLERLILISTPNLQLDQCIPKH
jgi:hypothetical protein